MFQVPLNEIKKRFRFSELILLGWRSQERSVSMSLKAKQARENVNSQSRQKFSPVEQSNLQAYINKHMKKLEEGMEGAEGNFAMRPEQAYRKIEQVPLNMSRPMPGSIVDESGCPDISKMTSDQALKFLRGAGISLMGT